MGIAGARWGLDWPNARIVLPPKRSHPSALTFPCRPAHPALSVDAVAVVPLTAEAAPEGAKGLGTLVGWLMVEFGAPDGLGSVVAAVRGWALRTRSSVELSIGGDVLKVTGATSEQQEKIIGGWLARHAPG